MDGALCYVREFVACRHEARLIPLPSLLISGDVYCTLDRDDSSVADGTRMAYARKNVEPT